MATKRTEDAEMDLTAFRKNRIKKLETLYSDDSSTRRRLDRQVSGGALNGFFSAAQVRDKLAESFSNNKEIVKASREIYATNPIYASVINYLSDMFYWRYKVTPHKVYNKSKAKLKKQVNKEDFALIYNLMIEVVDGLSIETKFPELLSLLYLTGSVYFTTVCDADSIAIDSIQLPNEYCRKIGETQFGTAIIQFDFNYFNSLSLNADGLKDYLKSFPKEFQLGYNKYSKDANKRWQTLDPRFSTGILLNEFSIPTYFYLYGGILDYEQYQDNELERNENLLKYIVVHTMPHYEDKLIFEVDEVAAIHKSLKKIVDTGEKARLITTYGDVHVDKISENDTSENEVLSKAFKAIFNNAGFNSGVFTSETVTGLELSLIRDKAMVWKHIQSLLNFYTIAINNWFDFKNYQADIDILQISPYTYKDDIDYFRQNATLGVGKLDYIIASGIKQKNVQDTLFLENFLELDKITPMQTSYTQTAEDRSAEETSTETKVEKEDESDIEPSDKSEVETTEESE